MFKIPLNAEDSYASENYKLANKAVHSNFPTNLIWGKVMLLISNK
jgi:hypothetical protein